MADTNRNCKAKENCDLFIDKAKYPHKKLYVNLPICPSINHMYYGKTKTLTSRAKRYIMEASALIRLAIEEQKWCVDEGDAWMYLDMIVYMPDRKIRDSHNMLKLMLDIFQGLAFTNDYFVCPRIQGVEYDVENPRIETCLSYQTDKDRKKCWL